RHDLCSGQTNCFARRETLNWLESALPGENVGAAVQQIELHQFGASVWHQIRNQSVLLSNEQAQSRFTAVGVDVDDARQYPGGQFELAVQIVFVVGGPE